MKAKINKRIMLFYSLMGAGLFLTSGFFILQSWERAFRNRTRDLAMCKGIISIINGVIFAMDAIFTFRQKKQPLIFESWETVEDCEVDDNEDDKNSSHTFAFKITYLKTQILKSEDQKPKITQQ